MTNKSLIFYRFLLGGVLIFSLLALGSCMMPDLKPELYFSSTKVKLTGKGPGPTLKISWGGDTLSHNNETLTWLPGSGPLNLTAALEGYPEATGSFTINSGYIPVSSVTVDPQNAILVLDVFESTPLGVEVLPINATNPTVVWSSDNTGIATVDSDGLVTGVTKDKVTIRATADGQSGTCLVTVK